VTGKGGGTEQVFGVTSTVRLFTEHTGRTLHQLRHSALTHLPEAGVDASLLEAKSRHASLRSCEVELRPSADGVKELTAEHDRLNRRR